MIRVLRVMEYTYPDVASYIKDTLLWTNNFNKNGITMRSAEVTIDWNPPEQSEDGTV